MLYLQFALTLPRRERNRIIVLLICSVLMSFVEVAGMTSILPFLSVAADPALVQKSAFLSQLYKVSGAQNINEFVVYLGLFALGFVVLSGVIGFSAQWAMVWYSLELGRDISARLFANYVQQPYTFFLSRNSMNLTLNSTDEVEGVINGTLMPALQIVGKGSAAIFLVGLVVFYDPVFALMMLGVVGGTYGLLFAATRKLVASFGERAHVARRARFRKTRETFGAIKELRILGRDKNYIQLFETLSAVYSRNLALHSIIAMAPRYALEAIAVTTMAGAIVYSASHGGNLSALVPTLILYGVAGYRLLPSFQAIFSNFTTIRFNRSSIEALLADPGTTLAEEQVSADSTATRTPLTLDQSISLRSVTCRYDGKTEPALEDVDMDIKALTTVGIVGSSGAGKSTLIDVLTGLLPIERGEIRVDGVLLSAQNIADWRRLVGYVPQQIYLSDESVRGNIALGVNAADIDQSRVEEAARLASIHDFVATELPEGYDTIIGENGVRLSGGQRQRLGIARALYRDPGLLIFDEATSALDGLTEEAVIAAIKSLSKEKTIVVIAHRLATVQHCENIFLFDRGRVIDQGTYQDLIARNRLFRQMARAAN